MNRRHLDEHERTRAMHPWKKKPVNPQQAEFQQRRMKILAKVKQLKMDIDAYNENFNQGDPIEMPYDFTDDLSELEQPTRRRRP